MYWVSDLNGLVINDMVRTLSRFFNTATNPTVAGNMRGDELHHRTSQQTAVIGLALSAGGTKTCLTKLVHSDFRQKATQLERSSSARILMVQKQIQLKK